MLFAQVPGELNDGLHALHLALDNLVEVLLLDLGEGQEVNGTGIGFGVLRHEWLQALVDVLREERRV